MISTFIVVAAIALPGITAALVGLIIKRNTERAFKDHLIAK